MRVFLKDKKVIAYFEKQANPEFWDNHWHTQKLKEEILNCRTDQIFIPAVRKYLPTGSIILEGGCGKAKLVHALNHQGYRTTGIDFASQTMSRVHSAVPELHIVTGDLRKLPFQDNSFDGYLSVGVIEHFWEGYSQVIKEMYRTINSGGYLFVSFPHMSPLRKLKIYMGKYQIQTQKGISGHINNFYQYVLYCEQVLGDLRKFGFELKEKILYDGIKGFKDEVSFLKPFLQPIYDRKKLMRLRPYLDKLLKPFSSHMMLLILQKLS